MKKILPIILFFILIISGTAIAADVAMEEAIIDRDTQELCVSGTVIPDAGVNEIIIMLLNPGQGISDLENVASITDFNACVEYFRQISLAEDGFFSISADINNPSVTVDNLPDEYTLVISGAGFDAPYVHGEKVNFYTSHEVEAAITAVNGALDIDAMKTVLKNNYDIIGIRVELTEDASIEIAAKLILARRPEGGFEKAAEIRTIADESEAFSEFNSADAATRVSLLETPKDALGIAALPAMTVYKSLSKDGKTRVASKMGNTYSEVTPFKADFITETLLSAVQYLPSHTLLRDAFDKCQSALTGSVKITEYLSLTDTSSVDKEITTDNFDTVSALALIMNPLIEAAANPPAPDEDDVIIDDGGGGDGGGGGPSYKFETPKVEPTPIVVPEKKEIFTDLAESEWAKDAIEALYEKEIISGKSDGVFDPQGSVKREEFAKMIVLTFDIEEGAAAQFSDVAENAWYYTYVSAAAQNGIIGGMGDGSFGAGRNITRQDMAVMIYRAAEKSGIIKEADADLGFTDASEIAPYAIGAVNALSSAGVINGTPEGTFMPESGATRAQAAKMIYEIVKMLDNAECEVRG